MERRRETRIRYRSIVVKPIKIQSSKCWMVIAAPLVYLLLCYCRPNGAFTTISSAEMRGGFANDFDLSFLCQQATRVYGKGKQGSDI